MVGKIICTGLGPGDPDLISVRSDRLIRAARHVAYFRKAGRPGQARRIVEGMLAASVTEYPMEYPVTTELPFGSAEYNRLLASFYDDWAQRLQTLVAGYRPALQQARWLGIEIALAANDLTGAQALLTQAILRGCASRESRRGCRRCRRKARRPGERAGTSWGRCRTSAQANSRVMATSTMPAGLDRSARSSRGAGCRT